MIKHIKDLENITEACVAIGGFDGMHGGHLAIIERLVAVSKHYRCPSVVISRDNDKNTADTPILSSEEEKAFLLEKAGVDILISGKSGEKPAEATQVLQEILQSQMRVKAIVIGQQNLCFAMMQELAVAQGIEVIAVETRQYQNEPITIERIRKALAEGRISDVTAMCGHPYTMIGTVEHGQALGRTVGMPTANTAILPAKVRPANGVYATLTNVEGKIFRGITNVGTRPTVDNRSDITIETFLLDFSRDIYGETVITEFHQYIRGVKKFGSLAEVKQQVERDIAQMTI